MGVADGRYVCGWDNGVVVGRTAHLVKRAYYRGYALRCVGWVKLLAGGRRVV